MSKRSHEYNKQHTRRSSTTFSVQKAFVVFLFSSSVIINIMIIMIKVMQLPGKPRIIILYHYLFSLTPCLMKILCKNNTFWHQEVRTFSRPHFLRNFSLFTTKSVLKLFVHKFLRILLSFVLGLFVDIMKRSLRARHHPYQTNCHAENFHTTEPSPH